MSLDRDPVQHGSISSCQCLINDVMSQFLGLPVCCWQMSLRLAQKGQKSFQEGRGPLVPWASSWIFIVITVIDNIMVNFSSNESWSILQISSAPPTSAFQPPSHLQTHPPTHTHAHKRMHHHKISIRCTSWLKIWLGDIYSKAFDKKCY